jgi:hypothetical protein
MAWVAAVHWLLHTLLVSTAGRGFLTLTPQAWAPASVECGAVMSELLPLL